MTKPKKPFDPDLEKAYAKAKASMLRADRFERELLDMFARVVERWEAIEGGEWPVGPRMSLPAPSDMKTDLSPEGDYKLSEWAIHRDRDLQRAAGIMLAQYARENPIPRPMVESLALPRRE